MSPEQLESIAETIVRKIGETRVLLALAVATMMMLTAVGVFVDVAIITVAPISGVFMSGATASTTAGTAVVSSVFGETILNLGVPSLAGVAMIHAGATVLDHLPHGSFFHATAGSVHMEMNERIKLIPYGIVRWDCVNSHININFWGISVFWIIKKWRWNDENCHCTRFV